MPSTLAVCHLVCSLISSLPPVYYRNRRKVIPFILHVCSIGEGMAPAANTVNAAETLPPSMDAILFLRKKGHVYIYIQIYVCIYT